MDIESCMYPVMAPVLNELMALCARRSLSDEEFRAAVIELADRYKREWESIGVE